MEGHGNLMQRLPLTVSVGSTPLAASLPSINWPFSSSKTGWIPGKGKVACVGTAGVTPARLLIMMPPVSVCHQVSMMGQRPLPMCLSYQCHASSLMGSPTVPKTRKELRSLPSMGAVPKVIRLRMAVGAVYRMVILNFCTMSQKRLASGNVGMPSNIMEVAPALNGPYTI